MDLKVARQHIASIEQQIANTVVALNGDPNIEIDRHPTVRAAKAQLDRARLNLSYATVVAPDDGIVAKVDDLQVGDFVNPGAAVFSMMSSRRIWIEANFRETGLTHMRPGQEAAIDVDAYPDRTFKAHVVSMSPGTGSDFAVLPPENATGNWVKVVQRLPVRLEFDEIDPNRPLFSGISVTARVDTGYRRTWRHPLQTAARERRRPR
jgi:membrane fusion protein (multidrug efflux system)